MSERQTEDVHSEAGLYAGGSCRPLLVPFSLWRDDDAAVRAHTHTHRLHMQVQQCLINAVRGTCVFPAASCCHASLHFLLLVFMLTANPTASERFRSGQTVSCITFQTCCHDATLVYYISWNTSKDKKKLISRLKMRRVLGILCWSCYKKHGKAV